MPLRCIVADDEPLALMLLEKYIEQTPGLELAGAFSSSAEARRAIESAQAPLAFLDIQMPGINGLQLAREAEKTGVKVVFTTAFRDYALEGFRVNAVDYLLKPVSYDEFLVAVNRASEIISSIPAKTNEDETIVVRSNWRNVVLNLSDIAYIEGLKDYIKIHLSDSDKSVVTQMSMKSVESMLPAEAFARVHRSYIVSLGKVASYTRTSVTLSCLNGIEIPVGDRFRDNFFRILAQN